MEFQRRIPQPPLSFFVEFLWSYKDLDVGHSAEKLLPDGSMELIIDLAPDDSPKRLYQDTSLERFTDFRRAWISGMHRKYLVLGVEKGASMMGAHFKTGGAAPFFGFPLSELSGNVVELDLIWKRAILSLREQLLEVEGHEAKFDLLEGFLLAHASSRLNADSTLNAALSALRSWPAVSLRELSSALGLSQKQVINQFHDQVGLTPKLVSRIFRFQHALSLAYREGPIDWARTALDAGYYDQAHMIHEFREFAGATPLAYHQNRSQYPGYIVLD